MADVWSSANSNTSQVIVGGEVEQTSDSQRTEHTRIYQMVKPTIMLDEMSLPINTNGLSSNLDANGEHIDSDGTGEQPNEISNQGSAQSFNPSLSIGNIAPLLRINDHYFSYDTIEAFELRTVDFIPTIHVTISTFDNDLLRENIIKEGDICSVFIQVAHGMVKSYRGDFVITYQYMFKQQQNGSQTGVRISLTGELAIPNLYNGCMTFSYAGTSRDALIDVAEKLGLGFFFCDEENTNDTQLWYCTSNGNMVEGGDSPVIKYIKNIASHSYKAFDAFYDCWIDPRYGLTFLNINKMLGEDGLDEDVDATFYNNTLSDMRAIDGNNVDMSAEQKKKKPRMQPKILSNIDADIMSATSFYVIDFQENFDNSITNQLGLSVKFDFDIKNTGLDSKRSDIDFNYSICTNNTKLQNGFYILGGPGDNKTYKQADNGDYIKQHASVQGGRIAETMSDIDASEIKSGGTNMMASGNTNKFYDIGEGHNRLNNLWLNKRTVTVTLNGCNLQIMRGEKIPVMLLDKSALSNILTKFDDSVQSKLIQDVCGWFIIKDIRWVYSQGKTEGATKWKTILTLTRREWPIHGYNKEKLGDGIDTITVVNDLSNTANTKTMNDVSGNTDNSSSKDIDNKEDMSTNGLSAPIKTIYQDIVNACRANGYSVKLISGRRWAADEEGNRTSGLPTIQEGSLYKFINANGDIVWYSSPTSRHLYGDAIDIVNGSGCSFSDILKSIIDDDQTLVDMFNNGMYCAVEQSKDDTGNVVKHFHIGNVDKNDSSTSSSQQKWWTQVIKYKGNTMLFGGRTYNFSSYLAYNE